MTDSERWQAFGELLDALGEMPPYDVGGVFGGVNGEICRGLCDILLSAKWDGCLTDAQRWRMRAQLLVNRSRLTKNKTDRYFWPCGEVAPRIEACYKLAEWTKKRS